MKTNSRLKDPGLIIAAILIIISAIVFIWWPADVHIYGISLVGWLMFFSYFIWFALAVIYVVWMERKEKGK
ncbi:hypothetical protein ACFO3D_05420 [Virgibacillus kekensis]|uniref:DUF3311 domain-containing protein n=1 Tax=Virgibacillus kekensis TaxID=202261 RepID=A0ABV9DFV2_9BACI